MTTILVADDNSNIQKMVTNALKDKGIQVIGVTNGEAAIKKLENLSPDMVLADVFMPVRDGYELCEWIKKNERLAAVPVFLLVGAFDPLDEHRVQSVKADGVLKKPFVPPDHLIGAVSAMLERAAKTRAAAELEMAHGEFAASVPQVQETQKLSEAEVAEMTGQAAPAAEPEPEPEIPEYTRPARLSFGETEQPMAFGDVLAEPRAAEPAAEEAEERPTFRASSMAGMDFESGAVEEHGIVEEMKQPSPDEPPIKVEFGGGEAPELITADQPEALSSLSAMESAPLTDLVGAGESVAPAAAAPPPPPAPAPELATAPIPEVRVPEPEPVLEPEPASPPLGVAARAPTPPSPTPEIAAPPPTPAPREPEPPARLMPLSPAQQEAMVDEIVDRVLSQIQPQIIHRITTEVGKGLEMLQPQLIERITKEVIRPLAEELVRRRTE